jgi:sialate O-acetylesterase
MFALALLLPLTQAPDPEADFVPLLTAADLASWRRTGSATFAWEDGTVSGRDAGERNSFLASPRTYGDFELRCAVKIEPGGNSGIQIRSHVDEAGDFVVGWQVEIETTDRRWSGGLYEEGGRGWLDPLDGQEAARAAFRIGEWNEYRVLCIGSRVRTWVNDVSCADWEEPGCPTRGLIALQVHGGAATRVRWRDLRLREILPVPRSFSFHALIGDHAVLSADGAVVSGWAPAGARVDLRLIPSPDSTFGPERTFSAEAGADGLWRVGLPPTGPGGPFTLQATSPDPRANWSLIARDVCFGDVWLCAGQSNMQWPLADTNRAAEEIAAADLPFLRVYTVPYELAPERRADLPRGEAEGAPGTWTVSNPQWAARYSAVAFHFGRALHPHAGRPIGLVVAAWGGTPAEAWTPLWAMKTSTRLRHLVEGGGPAAPGWADGSWEPGAIFHGMIAPLADLRPRGVIWYQGESNAGRAAEYEHLFPALIRAWRRELAAPRLPFLFVQLANFRDPVSVPVQQGSWAEIREAQRLTALRTPDTGMAVAVDVGEARDIHPRDKRTVGERLARLARAVAYGEQLLAQGPAPRTMTAEESGAVRIRFDHAGGGLIEQGGGSLRGFAIAGADGIFHPALAAVASTDEIALSASGVADPREVRYGWADNPGCNLANREGLPATPFRLRATRDLFAGGLAAQWVNENGGAPGWAEEEGGVATVRLLAGSILTREPIGDCELYLEFRVPEAPEILAAQQRGNSGVYLQRRYEIQILDSCGLVPGDQECAAIYRQRPPDWNASLPAGAWQRYHLRFTQPCWNPDGSKRENARVTVWHNGALVHDDVEIRAKTGAGQAESPAPAPLSLQDHGQAVSFRNVLFSPR